jgi:2,4-dienoyl-CoA reductase-like NADH-dependent reductase (Old Yellow Enzyme family)
MPGIFDSFDLRDLHLRNRIGMSPMCQYMATDGVPNDWHHVHYVSRAVGGVGLIIVEMTNVESRGRISDACLGLWNEEQASAHAAIVAAARRHGAAVGVQLAHAGRKSRVTNSVSVAPSAIPFDADGPVPHALTTVEVEGMVEAFAGSARRAVEAGYDMIELHGAHGYLIHQFLSPASNRRDDHYARGERFVLDVISEVRRHIPGGMPLGLRLSAVDGHPDGYQFPDLQAWAASFLTAGVDVLDISGGGNGPLAPQVYPGYQVPYARSYKHQLGCPVMTVGRLEDPALAEHVLRREDADIVLLGRGLLVSPYWVREAAASFGGEFTMTPSYERGFRALR